MNLINRLPRPTLPHDTSKSSVCDSSRKPIEQILKYELRPP